MALHCERSWLMEECPPALRMKGVCLTVAERKKGDCVRNRGENRLEGNTALTLSSSWGSGRDELGSEHSWRKSWKDRE